VEAFAQQLGAFCLLALLGRGWRWGSNCSALRDSRFRLRTPDLL